MMRRARKLIAQGADIIDIGAESTRPGSTRCAAARQLLEKLDVVSVPGARHFVMFDQPEKFAAALEGRTNIRHLFFGHLHRPRPAHVADDAGHGIRVTAAVECLDVDQNGDQARSQFGDVATGAGRVVGVVCADIPGVEG